MKKVLCLAALAAVAGAAALAADPEIVWREKLRAVVTTNGLAVAADTNATTTATAHTPVSSAIAKPRYGPAAAGSARTWPLSAAVAVSASTSTSPGLHVPLSVRRTFAPASSGCTSTFSASSPSLITAYSA